MSDRIAYKVLTAAQWAALEENAFAGAPIDLEDGYVHLSTAAQLTETVDRHFSGVENLVLVAVDLARLGTALRWEPSRRGEMFPHLYAPFDSKMVLSSCPLTRDADGTVRVPP